MSFLSVIGGPFVWMWEGLAGIGGQILGYLVFAGVIIAFVVGIYFMISYNASQSQLLKDQKQQLQQVLKNQEKFAADTKYLIEAEKKLVDELNSTIQSINTKNDKLDAFLDSAEAAKANRSSSSILKETIKQLGK